MKVLVPFEVQPVSERAVRTAIDLFGGDDRIRIICVHLSGGDTSPAEIAASEIESMGADRNASIEAEVRTLEAGDDSRADVRDAIEEIVETRAIDVIVLGYEERSLFERLFESDTSERMLQTHGLPVVLVP